MYRYIFLCFVVADVISSFASGTTSVTLVLRIYQPRRAHALVLSREPLQGLPTRFSFFHIFVLRGKGTSTGTREIEQQE